MSSAFYRPPAAGEVLTSHNVCVAGKREGATPLTLTCRWLTDMPAKAFVIFCHGLGASRDDYAELSEFWAAHGYLVIHPNFPDSIREVAAAEPDLGLDSTGNDLAQWSANARARARMHEILHAPEYWMKRVHIIESVLDELPDIIAATCQKTAGTFPGAIAGHSFGAYSAQLIAGAEIDMPGKGAAQFADERIAAAILLSAQGRDQQGLREGSWDKVAMPVLTVTGTLDRGAKNQDWRWKSEPFHLAPAGGKYLAILDDADHYLGDLAGTGKVKDVPSQRKAVNQLTLGFLDAWVLHDESALFWLNAIADRIVDAPVQFERK